MDIVYNISLGLIRFLGASPYNLKNGSTVCAIPFVLFSTDKLKPYHSC